ncbi:unnamed protein product [Paramecium pentaurelia]|uniref:Uncharacterized protein n=1 Tax=Paramecium pentaurelia TaxID=43138 RepID=A0A8S1SEJ0_9CILI|nr:unnamed protein product [Paramecium pentaurelia]
MKQIQLLLLLNLAVVVFSQTTNSTEIQQEQTSGQKSNPLNCTDTQIAVHGTCVEAGTCASKLNYFKQKKQSSGADQLPNKPEFEITLENGNLKVQIKFQNSVGLETALEAVESCLQVSLYRFTVGFLNETKDTTSTLTSVLNADNSRSWFFIIDKSNFDNYLAKDAQTNYIVYSGFYAVNVDAITSTYTKQIASFAFNFAANLTSDLSTLNNFVFQPKLRGEPVCADSAQTKCVQQAASKLELCGTDPTCETIVTNPELVVNETIYFKQSITENGFTDGNWHPGDAQITVTANGVTKQVKPKLYNQTADGTIYQVKFRFIANNVSIASDAVLLQSSNRRLLTDVSDASAVAAVSSSCIKESTDAACPSDTEVLTYNSENCSGISCDVDETSIQVMIGITLLGLIMLSLL